MQPTSQNAPTPSQPPTHKRLQNLLERVKRRRRLTDEEELLEKWATDVCSGEELPEVEIISLLEEQIPKYKLRADTLTSFTGYENQDWFIPSPALKPEEIDSPLTPDQIRETLNYFLVCSDRVSQMSRTYNDSEALTRLLEEKERDLELTARLGQQLLAQNGQLQNKIDQLEIELRETTEKSTQLYHELQKKSEIVRILTNDFEDSGSEANSPVDIRFELLKKKVDNLEEENKVLKNETVRLTEETEECEMAEARLVKDLVDQLDACRYDLDTLGLDGERAKQRELELKEQIEHLEVKLRVTNERLEKALSENDEYLKMVTMLRETQCELATELVEFKEKYSELSCFMEEMKDNAKKTKKKSQPTVRVGSLFSTSHTLSSLHHPDSLAAELECSMLSEMSLDSGLGASSTGGSIAPNYKKVFDTYKVASRGSSLGSSTSDTPAMPPPMLPPRLGGTLMTSSSGVPFLPSQPTMLGESYSPSTVSDFGDEDVTYKNYTDRTAGKDIQDALRRLSMTEIEARRTALAKGLVPTFHDDYPTPDSIMSTSALSSYTPWKLPEKLQIVKPMEGSQTLHHWCELATPSMEGLLEEQPGVKIRGGTDLEALGLQTVTLSDIEEDDEVNPGKSFCSTNHVYTLTNSTVMHPDDNTLLVSSYRGSQMSTAASSRMSSACSTPRGHSRRNSTSTVSTAPGLARLLSERGIKAATPSTLVTPEYTPTATPCNSPDRPSSPTNGGGDDDDESSGHSSLGLPGFLMASGADLLWKTLGSALKSPTPPKSKQKLVKGLVRPDKKAALTGFRIVERIERIGLEELLSTNGGTSNNVSAVVEPGSPRTLHRAGLRRTLRSYESGPGVLGVPGRPGTGALEARLAHIPSSTSSITTTGTATPTSSTPLSSRADSSSSSRKSDRRLRERVMRSDLGSVPSPPGLAPQRHESLGTLSSIFFGRKGGLL